MSSAKSLAVPDRFLDRPLIYTENHRDPKIDPWGTPASTGDHEDEWPLTRPFEVYLIGSSQCILVVDQIFLRITVYKWGAHARLNQMLWICPKIYFQPQEMGNTQMMDKYHRLLKDVDIHRNLMVWILSD